MSGAVRSGLIFALVGIVAEIGFSSIPGAGPLLCGPSVAMIIGAVAGYFAIRWSTGAAGVGQGVLAGTIAGVGVWRRGASSPVRVGFIDFVAGHPTRTSDWLYFLGVGGRSRPHLLSAEYAYFVAPQDHVVYTQQSFVLCDHESAKGGLTQVNILIVGCRACLDPPNWRSDDT